MKRRSVLRWLPLLAVSAALLWPAQRVGAQPAATKETMFPVGSRIGMTPPPGMTPSRAFQGFEDVTNNIFMRLIAMPEQAYAEIEKTMTNQALKKQNITVERRESFALPRSKGLLIVARQDADNVQLRKWLLIAPLSGLTALVSLEIPLDAKGVYADEAIRASFSSLVARDQVPIEEQLTLVPFKLSDLAGFRVVGVVPGRAVQLTDGDKDTVEPIEQPHMIIGIAPGGPSQAADRDSFARLAFSGLPNLKEVRITSADSIRIGGQPGHELRASGKDGKTGADVDLVQWLRFGSGAYLRMVGFGPKESWIAAFTRFRQVRDGLELR
jgi:hypothetical protein